ncbi:MAG: hypothetical protein R3304_01690 [Longimicrobiales bacterium]|nr:hypothetical protein [Longimicrobiales bacterium]
MPKRCIRYRSGYKYQLREAHVDRVAIRPETPITTEWVSLTLDGIITLRSGYAWDGPSGPSVDTPSFMRGSLVHDALYQLMRLGALDTRRWRDTADRELRRMCREDGMPGIRAWWVYRAVRWFGEPSASPAARKHVETAPRGCR